MRSSTPSIFNAAVLVAALGYFVDIYDLVLFSIVRIPSLKSLGLNEQQIFEQGTFLINMQMGGMLLGGVLWGVLGDKRGRLSVLFGSILLYSLANLANAFIHTVEAYAVLRFIAGVGLAGELGAGITLVAESLPQQKRGYGTMIVATVGVSGALLAGFIGQKLDWRWAYGIGGGLGLALLVLRIGVFESGIFQHVKAQQEISRGNFFSLFTHGGKLVRYLQCIFIGLPTWFIVGILVSFSKEFGVALRITDPVNPALSIMYFYGGLVIGDFASGMLSQLLKSRKKIVLIFATLSGVMTMVYLSSYGKSSQYLYMVTLLMGIATGYWAIFATVAAEQFGTNLRATVATTVPNFVRGALVPVIELFKVLIPSLGHVKAALYIGIGCFAVTLLAALFLKDSFDKDLNYVE